MLIEQLEDDIFW